MCWLCPNKHLPHGMTLFKALFVPNILCVCLFVCVFGGGLSISWPGIVCSVVMYPSFSHAGIACKGAGVLRAGHQSSERCSGASLPASDAPFVKGAGVMGTFDAPFAPISQFMPVAGRRLAILHVPSGLLRPLHQPWDSTPHFSPSTLRPAATRCGLQAATGLSKARGGGGGGRLRTRSGRTWAARAPRASSSSVAPSSRRRRGGGLVGGAFFSFFFFFFFLQGELGPG